VRSSFVFALLLLAGCPAKDTSQGLQLPPNNDVDQLLDYNKFVCDVMPVLVRRCSYLGCHGNIDHAFRVFSVGKLRATDPMNRNDRDAPLTALEINLNFEAAVGVLLASTADDRASLNLPKLPLLQKPLAARYNGAEHHGVAIFPTFGHTPDNDPEWQQLIAWVTGATQKPPVQSCIDFMTNLGVTPR
jgi:hypothetical protein